MINEFFRRKVGNHLFSKACRFLARQLIFSFSTFFFFTCLLLFFFFYKEIGRCASSLTVTQKKTIVLLQLIIGTSSIWWLVLELSISLVMKLFSYQYHLLKFERWSYFIRKNDTLYLYTTPWHIYISWEIKEKRK